MDRRTVLKMAAGAALALGKNAVALPGTGGKRMPPMKNGLGYTYRVAFGAWINDMRNNPLPLQNWPAPQFDQETLDSAKRALDVQAEAGFNLLDAWGLFATFGYPPDIESAFRDQARARMVNKLLKAASERGMRVMFGMGLMSWGYDAIIQQDPSVRGVDSEGKPHPHAMCGTKEAAWKYVTKILDCALNEFDFYGVHLESCDLGCCMCPECAGKDGLVGYNVRMNIRAADYIKRKWPKQFVNVIPINWVGSSAGPNAGAFMPPEEQQIVELSRHIDCFMDQGWRGTFVPPEKRAAFIKTLHCDYGTSGGVWLYHCVRRNRLSYFMPYPRGTGSAIKAHFDDGARGCMIYQGPMINPAVEINTAIAGRLLADPHRSFEDTLAEAIEVYYKPVNTRAGQRLAEVFLKAEDAFFDNWPEEAKKNPYRPGEFHLEPLFADAPGRSMYLEQCLTPKGRGAYREGLLSVLRMLEGIEPDCRDERRIARINACIASVLTDIENLGYERVS